ncbi:MAG: hypothetical protein KKD64_06670 [Alphaproteobacteria bacterium]|nr:hypothetical protein [Alphaproteobacteria bacterium]MBU0792868.1 hypothetical protein [Alphaproteobacteria bacterium]MBU0876618.1 hypothetical protein [Alphaproteobacteria bacterium]MBU1769319.1 hypothetical protein [Alphaproteobacteria bacterium]
MTRAGVLALGLALLAMPAVAKDKPPKTWQATRTVDPITGATSCVVSAVDYVGTLRYSRTGYLYPVIEMNSTHGLLVGVSSGGRFRLPTGAILWRVDDQPFREIKPEDNPRGTAVTAAPQVDDAATKAVADAMALSNKLILSATATSTLASGETAKAMLTELRAGRGLIYRAAAISSPYGLPDPNMMRVGQFQKDGLKPIPVDASLGIALAECGIE